MLVIVFSAYQFLPVIEGTPEHAWRTVNLIDNDDNAHYIKAVLKKLYADRSLYKSYQSQPPCRNNISLIFVFTIYLVHIFREGIYRI